MHDCIICNKPTDNYIMWESEDKTECTPQYVCEKCMWDSIKKGKAEYKIKYDKALKYLQENNYKVVVTSYDDAEQQITEEFKIKDDIMECVDILRERMKQQGFTETWIDVDWETYEDCELELVTYLYFIKYSQIAINDDGEDKIQEEQAFWIELTNK